MFKRTICLVIIFTFTSSLIGPYTKARAAESVLGLPQPGVMVNLSAAYEPVLIRGLKINPKNPLSLDFIINTGNSQLTAADPQLKTESEKLIKYFFAALTLPEQEVWVNLSPYEKNRIIPDATGQTEMGRDMLAQDYILKQITASLIYPEKGLGKDFWDRIYAQAQEEFGTTQIPVNTFNKVWIVADKASIYEAKDTVLVVDSHLKVMLEEDYMALNKNVQAKATVSDAHALGSRIIRQIILPALEKEVNEGKNFANLRQIFHSIILAKWYKENLKTALLNQVYSDKNKITGVDVADKTIKEKIYQQYLRAYKKGVFNYIKEDIDQTTQQPLPRKYFSGGIVAKLNIEHADFAQLNSSLGNDKGENVLEKVLVHQENEMTKPAYNVSMREKERVYNVISDPKTTDSDVAKTIEEWARYPYKLSDNELKDRTYLFADIILNDKGYGTLAKIAALKNLKIEKYSSSTLNLTSFTIRKIFSAITHAWQSSNKDVQKAATAAAKRLDLAMVVDPSKLKAISIKSGKYYKTVFYEKGWKLFIELDKKNDDTLVRLYKDGLEHPWEARLNYDRSDWDANASPDRKSVIDAINQANAAMISNSDKIYQEYVNVIKQFALPEKVTERFTDIKLINQPLEAAQELGLIDDLGNKERLLISYFNELIDFADLVRQRIFDYQYILNEKEFLVELQKRTKPIIQDIMNSPNNSAMISIGASKKYVDDYKDRIGALGLDEPTKQKFIENAITDHMVMASENVGGIKKYADGLVALAGLVQAGLADPVILFHVDFFDKKNWAPWLDDFVKIADSLQRHPDINTDGFKELDRVFRSDQTHRYVKQGSGTDILDRLSMLIEMAPSLPPIKTIRVSQMLNLNRDEIKAFRELYFVVKFKRLRQEITDDALADLVIMSSYKARTNLIGNILEEVRENAIFDKTSLEGYVNGLENVPGSDTQRLQHSLYKIHRTLARTTNPIFEKTLANYPIMPSQYGEYTVIIQSIDSNHKFSGSLNLKMLRTRSGDHTEVYVNNKPVHIDAPQAVELTLKDDQGKIVQLAEIKIYLTTDQQLIFKTKAPLYPTGNELTLNIKKGSIRKSNPTIVVDPQKLKFVDIKSGPLGSFREHVSFEQGWELYIDLDRKSNESLIRLYKGHLPYHWETRLVHNGNLEWESAVTAINRWGKVVEDAAMNSSFEGSLDWKNSMRLKNGFIFIELNVENKNQEAFAKLLGLETLENEEYFVIVKAKDDGLTPVFIGRMAKETSLKSALLSNEIEKELLKNGIQGNISPSILHFQIFNPSLLMGPSKKPLSFEIDRTKRVVSLKEIDKAMQSQSAPGGIDLNASRINMQKSGSGVDIQFDPALIEQFKQGNFEGIVPVITSITPIADIYPLIGR